MLWWVVVSRQLEETRRSTALSHAVQETVVTVIAGLALLKLLLPPGVLLLIMKLGK